MMPTRAELEASIDADPRIVDAFWRVRARERSGGTIMAMASSAERMRILRQREHDGIIVLPIEIDHFDLVDGLIRRGDISEAASRDRKLLARAAATALRRYLTK